MRLVLTYVQGDGYTYSCDVALPVDYESGEALLVDFEAEARDAYQRQVAYFAVAGRQFSTQNFFDQGSYYGPEVLTVDEWFGK
jgi:hypothetical protein